MRIAAMVAVLLMSVALVFSGYALRDRFQRGKQTRIAICQSENVLRKILHEEHKKRLRASIKFLKDHPHGTPDFSVPLIRRAIADEREIVAETAPTRCV
jgi:hypothetical protein